MSDIKFECSHCQQHLACEELDAGKQIQCPACNQLIQIPQAPGATVPPAGQSRLRISHQNPKAPEAAVPLPSEILQPESLEPEPGRPRSWRWLWRLAAYAVVAVALIIAWPKLTRLTSVPKPSDVTKLSVQTLTVQFALLDSAAAKPDETNDAKVKFEAAMKENFGHANLTSFSEAQKLSQWVDQWPIGGAFKLVYNRDNTEVLLWSRIEGRNAIIRTFPVTKADDLPGILKQAKEGIELLSKSGS